MGEAKLTNSSFRNFTYPPFGDSSSFSLIFSLNASDNIYKYYIILKVICACMYVCMYVRMYVCMYLCVYVSMYVYLYVYTYV